MTSRTTKTLRCSNCTKPVHEVPVDYDLGDPVTCGACSAGTTIDGGPAFPGPLSLRDWFAGQALTGLLANNDVAGDPGDFAASAYRVADAMMAERSRTRDSDANAWNEAVGENGGGS